MLSGFAIYLGYYFIWILLSHGSYLVVELLFLFLDWHLPRQNLINLYSFVNIFILFSLINFDLLQRFLDIFRAYFWKNFFNTLIKIFWVHQGRVIIFVSWRVAKIPTITFRFDTWSCILLCKSCKFIYIVRAVTRISWKVLLKLSGIIRSQTFSPRTSILLTIIHYRVNILVDFRSS